MIRKRITFVFSVLIFALLFGTLINRISYDANFSVFDALSSASKKAHKTAVTQDLNWAYTIDDFQISPEDNYTESKISMDNKTYIVLCKNGYENKNELKILSNIENKNYEKSVKKVAEYYKNKGYNVNILEKNETMMTSFAHAGHFDLLLLREEAQK